MPKTKARRKPKLRKPELPPEKEGVPPPFTTKEYVAAGGCLARLRTRVLIGGDEDKPWTFEYAERDVPCVGKLHKGGNHLVTTIDGESVLVHETKDGKRWY